MEISSVKKLIKMANKLEIVAYFSNYANDFKDHVNVTIFIH